jgi:hypothetical protein
MNLIKIEYSALNSRQKETYNFQKVSSILADYGFATIKLSDDWQGADFIAQHINGETFLKVQLKSRLTFSRKYQRKNIFICFPHKQNWYLINHDEVLDIFLVKYYRNMARSESWRIKGEFHWGVLSKEHIELLAKYQL